MFDFNPIWLGFGGAMIFPFILLGAVIRPLWVPFALAIGGSLIWVYGLGIAGFLAGAIGSVIGILVGIPVRRGLLAFRASRVASHTKSSSGGTL